MRATDPVHVWVRRAQEVDRPAVGRVLAEGFPEKFGRIFGPDRDRAAAVLADLPASGAVYVAEQAGHVVGTFTLVLEERILPGIWPVLRRHLPYWSALRALLLLHLLGAGRPEPHTALVEGVAVLPEWRGRGVGRRMMAEALAQAHQAGRQRVGLYVLEGNEPALRLYRSVGFHVEYARPLGWQRWVFGARRVLYMTTDLGP